MNKNQSTIIDEENELVDNEIRLDELWQTIWANRLFLAFIVLISFPISIMYVNSIPPEFKAEAVLATPIEAEVIGITLTLLVCCFSNLSALDMVFSSIGK